MNAAQLLSLDLPARHRPVAWMAQDAAPSAFRECYRCAYGADQGTERVCTHPMTRNATGGPQPVAIVRAWGGGCGPDAFLSSLEA